MFVKMNLFKKKTLINYVFLIIFSLFNFSCSKEENYNAQIKGNTMGTYYLIDVIDVPIELKIKNIELEIKDTLIKANKILSNWDQDSEISIINKTYKTTAIKISDELNEVFKTAKEINAKSNGFFDLTLDPIIELLGFGYKSKQMQVIPKDNQIKNVLSLIGQKSFLRMNFDNNELIKINKDIKINLSSIGKGYGIDLIGKKLDQLGINNYIIKNYKEIYNNDGYIIKKIIN